MSTKVTFTPKKLFGTTSLITPIRIIDTSHSEEGIKDSATPKDETQPIEIGSITVEDEPSETEVTQKEEKNETNPSPNDQNAPSDEKVVDETIDEINEEPCVHQEEKDNAPEPKIDDTNDAKDEKQTSDTEQEYKPDPETQSDKNITETNKHPSDTAPEELLQDKDSSSQEPELETEEDSSEYQISPPPRDPQTHTDSHVTSSETQTNKEPKKRNRFVTAFGTLGRFLLILLGATLITTPLPWLLTRVVTGVFIHEFALIPLIFAISIGTPVALLIFVTSLIRNKPLVSFSEEE